VQISLACSPNGGDNSLFWVASGLNCPSGSFALGQTNLSRPRSSSLPYTSQRTFSSFVVSRMLMNNCPRKRVTGQHPNSHLF